VRVQVGAEHQHAVESLRQQLLVQYQGPLLTSLADVEHQEVVALLAQQRLCTVDEVGEEPAGQEGDHDTDDARFPRLETGCVRRGHIAQLGRRSEDARPRLVADPIESAQRA
jgi:hypothetical protein